VTAREQLVTSFHLPWYIAVITHGKPLVYSNASVKRIFKIVITLASFGIAYMSFCHLFVLSSRFKIKSVCIPVLINAVRSQ